MIFSFDFRFFRSIFDFLKDKLKKNKNKEQRERERKKRRSRIGISEIRSDIGNPRSDNIKALINTFTIAIHITKRTTRALKIEANLLPESIDERGALVCGASISDRFCGTETEDMLGLGLVAISVIIERAVDGLQSWSDGKSIFVDGTPAGHFQVVARRGRRVGYRDGAEIVGGRMGEVEIGTVGEADVLVEFEEGNMRVFSIDFHLVHSHQIAGHNIMAIGMPESYPDFLDVNVLPIFQIGAGFADTLKVGEHPERVEKTPPAAHVVILIWFVSGNNDD